MKQEIKETLGYVVNGLSFALFFYLAFTLEVLYVPPPIKYLGWILLGLGLVLVVLSTATLVRNREAGLIEGGIYGVVRHPMYLALLVTTLPMVLSNFDPLRIGIWLILLFDLLLKLNYEEKLLAAQLTGYDQYAQNTYRLIPLLY